jgi:MarR family transcriptional regulator, organic hydroperoxide resistance regulator
VTPPGSAAGRRRAYFHLQIAAHRLQTLANEHSLATAGITAAQAGALFAIEQSPGTSQRSLADTLRQRESAVTGMVNRLAKAGLIERRRDDNDQRTRQLWLTPAGEDVLTTVRAHTEELNRLFDEAVGTEKVDEFVDGLEALADLAMPDRNSRLPGGERAE